jgi:hypothetical protein
MAYDTSKEGLRNRLVKSIFGRNLGFADANNDVVGGPLGYQTPVDGWSSAGSTLTSTSVTNNLPAGGCSVIGASGASGTTAYTLAAPIPGVTKTLFNPTTGVAVVGTTGASAFICSSGSITSTLGIITFAGKGGVCVLQGLTTALWGVISPAPGVASASTAVTFG